MSVFIILCTTVVHNTAHNSSDKLSSYSPDNHHCTDVVYWMAGRNPTTTAKHSV